jgi:hypothetical protein
MDMPTSVLALVTIAVPTNSFAHTEEGAGWQGVVVEFDPTSACAYGKLA